MESKQFIPFNYGECESINEMIHDHEELYKIISGNQFDDFAVSWSGMFLHQAFHFLKDVDWSAYDERMNSVFYAYLETQTMQLEWIMYSLCCGQYELVLRELRNMIESAFLFYRFDVIPANKYIKGEVKLNQIDTAPVNETYGRKVFQKSGYAKWDTVYTDIYRPLCYYTHTKISKDRTGENYESYNCPLSPKFDDVMIFKCLKYMQQIILTEIDMMKTILKSVYNVDTAGYFDGIFDAVSIPNTYV